MFKKRVVVAFLDYVFNCTLGRWHRREYIMSRGPNIPYQAEVFWGLYGMGHELGLEHRDAVDYYKIAK